MDAAIESLGGLAIGRDSVNPTGLLNSPFAKLPLEVLFQILDDLRPHGRFVLSRTCRDLRYLTHIDWKAAYDKFSRDVQLDFLADLAHNQPNRWLCTICKEFHTVRDFRDMEGYHRQLRCLNRQRKGHMTHAQIQLATKAVRLQHLSTGELRPDALLKPWVFPQFPSSTYAYEPVLKAAPKVVDGKFLLFVEFNFAWDKRHETPALENLIQCRYPFCAHLRTDAIISHRSFRFSADKRYFEHLWEDQRIVRHVVMENGRYDVQDEIHPQVSTGGDLMGTIAKAFEEPVVECKGQCHICLTDYSIRVEAGRLICRGWIDYGTGDSPMDNEWQAQLGSELIMPHTAGSVRQRYEKQASAFKRRGREGSLFG